MKTLEDLRAALAERGISYDSEERIRKDHTDFYENRIPRKSVPAAPQAPKAPAPEPVGAARPPRKFDLE